jgi:GNAT superfamily N-acetyltransferase
MTENKKYTIRELKGKAEFQSMFPLIKTLNKDMSKARFNALLKEMLPLGYRCVGAYEGTKLVGLCGFWVGYRFWCVKYIDLDNVVVDPTIRSKGIGRKMVAWVEKEGKKLGCSIAGLDSYTTAYSAHRFYFREGYSILGYHFTKRLAKP